MIALQNMRMSCDSSYLLDQTDDQSTKPEEFATLLSEMLETPGTKVVVFSQWLRMHELIERRLKEKEIGYVLFHGGVPGNKRKDLIDRFRDDPNCRVFLATDAGGVGLNLQFASAVVNLDMPWNPAVLEQRIGRVHRLGQKRPVQVVNFVSQGTIEQGMLEVLRFKKSLFAGVLDGGEKDISFGGTRLTKFMETVEQTTASIPQPTAMDSPTTASPPPKTRPIPCSKTPKCPKRQRHSRPRTTPGRDCCKRACRSCNKRHRRNPRRSASSRPTPTVVRDDKTGSQYLQIPMPKPEVLREVTDALQKLLKAFTQ